MLDSVEHEGIAIAHSASCERRCVGTGGWFGETVGAEEFEAAHARQPTLALLLGAEPVDDGRDHVVHGEISGDARAPGCEALVDKHAFQPAEGTASHIFCNANAAEAEPGRAANDIARKVLGVVPLDCMGCDLFGRER